MRFVLTALIIDVRTCSVITGDCGRILRWKSLVESYCSDHMALSACIVFMGFAGTIVHGDYFHRYFMESESN